MQSAGLSGSEWHFCLDESPPSPQTPLTQAPYDNSSCLFFVQAKVSSSLRAFPFYSHSCLVFSPLTSRLGKNREGHVYLKIQKHTPVLVLKPPTSALPPPDSPLRGHKQVRVESNERFMLDFLLLSAAVAGGRCHNTSWQPHKHIKEPVFFMENVVKRCSICALCHWRGKATSFFLWKWSRNQLRKQLNDPKISAA